MQGNVSDQSATRVNPGFAETACYVQKCCLWRKQRLIFGGLCFGLAYQNCVIVLIFVVFCAMLSGVGDSFTVTLVCLCCRKKISLTSLFTHNYHHEYYRINEHQDNPCMFYDDR